MKIRYEDILHQLPEELEAYVDEYITDLPKEFYVCFSVIELECFSEFRLIDLHDNSRIDLAGYPIQNEYVQTLTSIDIKRKENKFHISIRLDYLSDEKYDPFWTNKQLVEIIEKELIGKGIECFIDDSDLESIYLNIDYKVDVSDVSFTDLAKQELKKLKVEIERAPSLLVERFYEFGHIKLDVPPFLRTPIKQYLSFFEDFVYHSKQEKIELSIVTLNEALVLKVDYDKRLEKKVIENWFFEFIDFVKLEVDKIEIEYTYDVGKKIRQNLMESLLHQVSSFKRSLEYSSSLNDKLIQGHEEHIKLLNPSDFSFKHEIRKLVSDDRLSKALCQMELRLTTLESPILEDIILLKFRLSSVKSEYKKGLVTIENKRCQLVEIAHSILEYLRFDEFK